MKVWIKLIKHFQGGSKYTYKLVEPNQVDTYENQQELMEEWGENSDGGENYGYRVDMEIMENGELPPKEWLEKEIQKREMEIEYHKKAIDNTENFVVELKKLL